MKRAVTSEELERPLVPYADAISLVAGSFSPLQPVELNLLDALNLVSAHDIVSDIDVPGFASSAMDGYAVRARDVAGASADEPVVLPVAGDVPAGGDAAPLEALTAATIMTGGRVPEGADAIVPWEETDRGDERVAVYVAAQAGRHIRPAAEDITRGEVVVRHGEVLDAVRLGVLASIGHSAALVHPRPRVAVLSTGDEIAAPGDDLGAGHVYDANTTLISALVTRAGGVVAATATLRDDPSAIASWLEEAAEFSDLIVTSGGASVGAHDWLRDVIERHGELSMWRVAVKPGKPVALGRIASTRVIALPGNPGSAFAGVHCFVAPAIKRMLGRDAAHPTRRAHLGDAVTGSPTRTLLCRVQLRGEIAVPMPAQSSVVLSNLRGADGFALIPPGGLPGHAEVVVELFEP